MLNYSKYYTPPMIAKLLIQHLQISSPSAAIDICCGSCNLLHAAAIRWPNIKLTGVDIGVDIFCHEYSDVCTIKDDGRKFAIEHNQRYPLVLANPPFDFVEKRNEYPDLFLNFSDNFSTTRLEIEMLFANLCLLSEDGTLMIIMPSSFVNAESHRKSRKHIAEKYCIREIIHLPDNTFGSANISSYALIVNRRYIRNYSTKLLALVSRNEHYDFDEIRTITQDDLLIGNWCSYSTENSTSPFDMYRGNISSQFFTSSGIPVLHTAKIQDPWKPSLRYIKEINFAPQYAEDGDIIVSRIGKSAGKWYRYIGDKIIISDCLYCIKDPDGTIARKIDSHYYSHPVKGVATRYITKADFISWFATLV